MERISPILRSLTAIILTSFLFLPINKIKACEANPILASVNITNDLDSTAMGIIDLMVSGGTGSYTYIWSNGATTQDLTGLIEGQYTVTITDTDGCTAVKGPNTVGNVVANRDFENLVSLSIYPNPTSTNLTIELNLDRPMAVSYDVFSSKGQLMTSFQHKTNQPSHLNLEVFPSGVYWLKIIFEGEIITRKIIKI